MNPNNLTKMNSGRAVGKLTSDITLTTIPQIQSLSSAYLYNTDYYNPTPSPWITQATSPNYLPATHCFTLAPPSAGTPWKPTSQPGRKTERITADPQFSWHSPSPCSRLISSSEQTTLLSLLSVSYPRGLSVSCQNTLLSSLLQIP